MNYSPKLRQAMEEIKAVLNKHDIAGVVVLHSPGYGEHYMKLDPSYSSVKMVQVEGNDVGIKLNVDSKTHPDPKERKKAVTNSVNMVEILYELTDLKTDNLSDISTAIHKAFENKGTYIENTPGKHTDSREIDN